MPSARRLMAMLYEYGSSSNSHASTISMLVQDSYVVLNVNAGPYGKANSSDYVPNSTVQTMIATIQGNGKKVLGYVNTQGSAWVNSGGLTSTYDGYIVPSGSSCILNTTKKPCDIIAVDPLVTNGLWSHQAFDSSDFVMFDGTNYYNCYSNYAWAGTGHDLRKQCAFDSGQSCFSGLGYIAENVDAWLDPGIYGADGIWFDNVYASPHPNPTSSTDPDPGAGGNSMYNWYKKVGSYVRTNYPGKTILFNGGNAAPPEWWITHETGAPFFDIWNLRELTYHSNGTTVWPSSSNIPAYIVNGTHPSANFCALLQNAGTMTSTTSGDLQTFYTALKNCGIEYGWAVDGTSYIYPTGTYDSVSLQNTAAANA